MKQIIDVNVRVKRMEADKYKADMLVVGLYSDANGLDKFCAKLDARLGGAIKKVLQLGDFKGRKQTSSLIYTADRIGAGRVLLVGLGEKKAQAPDTVRQAAAIAAFQAVGMKLKTIGLAIHQAFGGGLNIERMGQIMAEGACYGGFRYDEFITKDGNGRPRTLTVEVVDSSEAKLRKFKKGVSVGAVIGRAQNYARMLANRPGNVINPQTLAAEAKRLARGLPGLSCTVFDEKQMAAKKMGGILAVGSGSQTKPRLIILRYAPAGKAVGDKDRIALVGKAITFDAGGISIKPSAYMSEMKLDKSGGMAVLATMKAVAELKLRLNVMGIIPAAENLPSGTSYRPGDVITTFSGKTVEVLDTDAEGRMILCDALAYAAEQKCDPIIDIATLTGACLVALGKHYAGLMGNEEKLLKQIQDAADDSGEKVWHMPSGDEYLEQMRSKIADLKNLWDPRKYGDACCAAAFLGQFVGKAKWAHLDIAGMDIFRKATKSTTEGSSGFGVRLLSSYLINLAQNKA
jgi:leucyl aminopeptidase